MEGFDLHARVIDWNRMLVSVAEHSSSFAQS